MTFVHIGAHLSHRASGLGAVLATVAGLPQRFAARFAAARARAQTRALLAGLDDSVLKDIGVHRSEINSLVHDLSGERRRGRGA